MVDVKFNTEPQWELVEPRVLHLVGTEICIVYGTVIYGNAPYHVHRQDQCHGRYRRLEEAKAAALAVVKELLEMGVDP